MDFASRYKKLNQRQKDAVDSIDGPLMVVAGPGTGKTELLSMRTANILQKTDTLPENILCLTFTESGATAMRERLREIIGQAAYKVAIHTFHSFGSEIINQYNEYFYQGANFRPADELNSYELLRSIFDSLDYANPLATKMNGEYTHLSDVMTAISELKKSGLTSDELLQVLDANEAALDSVEPQLTEIFKNRVNKSTADLLTPISTELAKLAQPPLPPGIAPLGNVLALSIAHAVDAAADEDSTKPITKWKNTYLEKNDSADFVFKDRKRIAKLRAVSYVYYQYLLKMQESELYDFDDMVLRVVHAMEVFPDLRYNLQERFLYIMVDEFQDTNLAQMRILHNLTTDSPDAKPNLMVVGDDDQAIYSFQGAEVGNILGFRDMFEGTKLVTLTDNYRSAGEILSPARDVIKQGTSRLEHFIEEVDKSLTAHNKPTGASIRLLEYERISDERAGLVEQIRQQIKDSVSPGDIAVLARRHHELVALLPYFQSKGIAVNYERRDNVLENEAVEQLLLLSQVVTLLAAGRIKDSESLLPELLAHPAWNFAADVVWKLSLAAYKNRSGWLEEMSVRPEFTALHAWLVARSLDSLRLPVEHLLDELVGVPHSEIEEEAAFTSPLYEYFFSEQKRGQNPAAYLEHLEALRTIRAHLRDYKPGQKLLLSDFVEYVDLHKSLGNTITSVRASSSAQEDAVHLMTAHKSKGLEFNHVHIVGAIDSSWGEKVRSRSRLVSYPENIPLASAGDSLDERLRLFFVAMTRARTSLNISYSLANDSNKPTLLASFLSGEFIVPEQATQKTKPSDEIDQLRADWYQPYVSLPSTDMKQLLKPTLENYKLSVTHLNNFLDVSRGGPQTFLLNNLLRFPQAMSPNAAYGSAIHKTLQRAHMHMISAHNQKPHEDILHDFENNLREQNLSDDDFNHLLQRGTDSLRAFLDSSYGEFNENQQTELNFAHQQSRVGDAHLSGALDVASVDAKAKTIGVVDYKTGSASNSWQGKTDYDRIKLHKYKQQLMFYRLLIENSRDFHNYEVTSTKLVFVEPNKQGEITSLETDVSADELERFKELIAAVWNHITNLDLPDISSYSADYKGMLEFEDNLLEKL